MEHEEITRQFETSAPGYVRHSGILVDDRLLLDVGEKEYLNYHPRWIFITHFHSDHAALETGEVPKHCLVYAPEASRRIPNIQNISKQVVVGSYRVAPVRTVHSQRVKSVGYTIEKGKERVFYSSDMISIDANIIGF